MSEDSYYREKFSNGVRCLVGLGDIRERVLSAMIAMITVRPEGFSDPDLAKRFGALLAEINSKPAVADEGTMKATLSEMSDSDAAKLASEIFSIHYGLMRPS